jgi:tyrosinase
VPQRLNVRSLSPQQKSDFVNTVLVLKSEGIYDEYVKLHSEAMMKPAGSNGRNFAHYGPIFLPWHREYLRRFEADIQKYGKNPSLTIPYWDWTEDALLPNPEQSPIWAEDFIGGNGDPQKGYNVQTGPFSANKWKVVNPDGSQGVLIRAFGIYRNIKTLPKIDDVSTVMKQTPYDVPKWDRDSTPGFRNYLEGWIGNPDGAGLHNRVHVWVNGTMSNGNSPADPVFFLHHANIDRIWASWQENHFTDLSKSYLPLDPIIDNGKTIRGHSINEYMFPWIENNPIKEGLRGGSVILKNVLDHRTLGYTYENYVH